MDAVLAVVGLHGQFVAWVLQLHVRLKLSYGKLRALGIPGYHVRVRHELLVANGGDGYLVRVLERVDLALDDLLLHEGYHVVIELLVSVARHVDVLVQVVHLSGAVYEQNDRVQVFEQYGRVVGALVHVDGFHGRPGVKRAASHFVARVVVAILEIGGDHVDGVIWKHVPYLGPGEEKQVLGKRVVLLQPVVAAIGARGVLEQQLLEHLLGHLVQRPPVCNVVVWSKPVHSVLAYGGDMTWFLSDVLRGGEEGSHHRLSRAVTVLFLVGVPCVLNRIQMNRIVDGDIRAVCCNVTVVSFHGYWK